MGVQKKAVGQEELCVYDPVVRVYSLCSIRGGDSDDGHGLPHLEGHVLDGHPTLEKDKCKNDSSTSQNFILSSRQDTAAAASASFFSEVMCFSLFPLGLRFQAQAPPLWLMLRTHRRRTTVKSAICS